MKITSVRAVALGACALGIGLLCGCATASDGSTQVPLPPPASAPASSGQEIAAAQEQATIGIDTLGGFAKDPGTVGDEARAALSKLESDVASALAGELDALQPSEPPAAEVAQAYSSAEQAVDLLAAQAKQGNQAATAALTTIDSALAAAGADQQGY